MPAAPTPPLTGAPLDTTAPGKASTDASVTSFGLTTNSQNNSHTNFTSRTSSKSKPYMFDSNVPSKNAINSMPRGSNSAGKENNSESNSNSTDCSSLQSKLSMPVPTNYPETDGCKNSRALCTELNEFISCIICKGYLIDATTVVECLHSCKYN